MQGEPMWELLRVAVVEGPKVGLHQWPLIWWPQLIQDIYFVQQAWDTADTSKCQDNPYGDSMRAHTMPVQDHILILFRTSLSPSSADSCWGMEGEMWVELLRNHYISTNHRLASLSGLKIIYEINLGIGTWYNS